MATVRALDEPDDFQNSYKIQADKWYKGFFALKPNNSQFDIDKYRVWIPQKGKMTINSGFAEGANARLDLFDSNGVIIYSNTSTTTQIYSEIDLPSAGWYFIQFSGYSGGGWRSYNYQYKFCPRPDFLTVSTSKSNLCSGEHATLSATNGYSEYHWYLNEIEFGNLSNQVAVNKAGVYTVQGVQSCGLRDNASNNTTITVFPSPAPPTIQGYHYCQGGSTIPLSATGTALRWYGPNLPTTGTTAVPTPSAGQVGRQQYFASQTVGGCESNRAEIYVDTDLIPAIPTVTVVNLCQNQAANSLSAVGQSLQWYTQQTGGSGTAQAPAPAMQSVGQQNFYVSQTIKGCESPRAKLTATINAVPVAPTVVSPAPICQSATASPLSAQGQSLRWYGQAEGGTPTNQETPATDVSGVRAYFVSQTVGGCESPRSRIDVTVKARARAQLPRDTAIYRYDSVRVQIALSGDAPWRVKLWDGRELSASQSPLRVTVRPNITTRYEVGSISNECGAGVVGAAMTITVLEPLSVSATSETFRLNAYPNPVGNELFIDWMTQARQQTEIRLLNLNGQVVYQTKTKGSGQLRTEKWDLKDIPAGVYVVNLIIEQGRVSQIVVKQ